MATYQFYIYSASALGYNATLNAFVLDAGYSPYEDRLLVTVTDDDTILDSTGDATQIATITDLDGNLVASGPLTSTAYGICDYDGGGIEVYFDRMQVNGINYGYSASEPLTPGASYPYFGSSVWDGDYPYYQSVSVPCFASGTRIATPFGPRPVEALLPGEMVMTLDHGPQPVLWKAHILAARPGTPASRGSWPVTLSGGWGRPLVVSAQHRVLVRDPWFQLSRDSSEVLAPACGLAPSRRPDIDRPPVWHHLLLARHEVIRAEGVWTESLFTGGAIFAAMPALAARSARAALAAAGVGLHATPARPCLSRTETIAARLASRPRGPLQLGARTGSPAHRLAG